MQSEHLAYGAVYDYPGKGHDRVFLDHENSFFAALDGAGGDELSGSIAQHLPEVINAAGHTNHESCASFMCYVITQLDNLPEATQRRSTGAFIHLARQDDGATQVVFANIGDSRLYVYSEPNDELTLLAHTPTVFTKSLRQKRQLVDAS
jgi:serine/threonine protein phosphatase PrpC